MTKPNRLAWGAYFIAAAVIVVDQISKAWILNGLHLRELGRIELSPVFDLSYVLNTGVSFGLLGGGEARWLLTVFSIAVAIALALWVRTADRRLFGGSVALIMGGALGNVIDRIRFGGVVDFLDFSDIRFPEFFLHLQGLVDSVRLGRWIDFSGPVFPWVFNVADSAISIGVVLLLLDSVLSDRRQAVGDTTKNT